jgi:hypothetical protein
MKRILFILVLMCLEKDLHAQYVYTIKADSVKITNTCDTAELIIENRTQTVPGFLFNKGRGRTEFRRGLSKVDDSIYVIGIDTLRLSVAWLQGGNTFGTTGFFGTRDNNHIDFYTNNTRRGRWTNTGNLLVGTESDNGYKLAVGGTTYSQYFTNSTTSLGSGTSGALRLRWGGAEGTYFDFYYQGNTNRRGMMGTASDSRPLYIFDSVGFSFLSTPYVALGLETGASINSRFTIASPRTSGWDPFTIIGSDSELNKDFAVKVSGNTILGGYGIDNGYKLQVNGISWLGNDVSVSHPTYSISNYGGGLKWVGDNMFQIYGGPNHEALTFGPANTITSNVLFEAPVFSATNTSPSGANYLVPFSGGYYSTYGLPSQLYNTVYHTFTTSTPQPGSGVGSVTLMEINKPVNRGGTEHDGLETGLRIKFTVSGTATKLRALETVNGDVRLHTTSGRTSIGLDGSSTITSRLDVSGEDGYNQLRLRKKYTPTSSSDNNGAEGDVSWDDNYIYIKTSSGWKRTSLSTF